MHRLAEACVGVVGLGALGGVAASALAAAGVGRVRCIDSAAVSAADPYLAQLYGLGDVGRPRAEVVQERIAAVAPETSVEVNAEPLLTDEAVAGAVAGADFVLGCVDPGLASVTYKLNRVCLEQRISWTAGTASAFMGVVGPTVIPYETACYLCYQGRAIACLDDPPTRWPTSSSRTRARRTRARFARISPSARASSGTSSLCRHSRC